jgi:serine/threonine protein kinase
MDATDEHATEILLDGRYRLGPCLGRGGMAAVYRAEDTVLGRTVAIKLLSPADEESSAEERARGETMVLASLNHPSLVTLYDARLDPEHARYLAIEYVDGPTLASRLSDGPLSSSEAASLARDLAEALQVVHGAGIVHRDVKPSNVMLARMPRRAAGWTAKLMDFGIAYSVADPRVTSPGVVVGTAAYMAPEQVRGADLTPAVDIYSLGLVLIESLTGEPAFPVMGKVQTALRRLSEAPEIPVSLGPRWGALLTRMTRVSPEARPSARQVSQAAAMLGGGPLLEQPPHQPLPPALSPIVPDDQPSGPTEETVPGVPLPAPRHRARRLRRAALASMAVAAATMIAIAGFSTFALAPDSAGRVASRMSADEVFTPPIPETVEPTESDQTGTESESDPVDDPVDDPVEDVGDDEQKSNPNKGPGNNSGDRKDDKDDKKGK